LNVVVWIQAEERNLRFLNVYTDILEETKRAGMEALDSILVGLTPVKEEKPRKQAKHMRTVEDDDATTR
jgi:hypothetical protein